MVEAAAVGGRADSMEVVGRSEMVVIDALGCEHGLVFFHSGEAMRKRLPLWGQSSNYSTHRACSRSRPTALQSPREPSAAFRLLHP